MNKEDKVIFALPGTISKRDAARIMNRGYFVVEVTSFDNIRMENEFDKLDQNDLLFAAIKGLQTGNYTEGCKKGFAEEMLRIIEAKRKK